MTRAKPIRKKKRTTGSMGELFITNLLRRIEVVAGLCLMTNVRSRSGAVLSTALLAAFTMGVIAALLRGLDIECGCFGTADASTVGAMKIFENVGMLALGLVASRRIP